MNKYTQKLIYNAPAEEWHNALPIGNGRLGAMIYGRPGNELLALNEDSIWSGGFRKRNNPKARANLDAIRSLLAEERIREAEALCEDSFYGTNEQQRHYMPLGDLNIYCLAEGYTDYCHELSLEYASDTVRYTVKGVTFTRTTFASKPDEVIVMHITADKPGAVSFCALIDGRDDYYDENRAYDEDTLLFTVTDTIPYACAITAVSEGGTCGTDANRIKCDGADSATIIIAAQTAYRTGDYIKKAISQAKAAARKPYKLLLDRHTQDYTALYGRCAIDIEGDTPKSEYTPDRLAAVREGGCDNALVTLYYNFSRYLMIAGSREGTLPLNLQGIWNHDMWPAWGCKYTININTEMNYWGAEVSALPECHTPLFDHIERMRENGRVTAREMYGCRGTVCHHNTDIWGDTAPQDKWMPATLWPMGLAWLCTHIRQHYLFTQDTDFLAEKYDTIAEVCEFFLDFLTENKAGQLVVSPSVSPENTYICENGEKGSLCQGAAMDTEILTELFNGFIEAHDILSAKGYELLHEEDVQAVKEALLRLPPIEEGKYGQIKEWAVDYDEAEPGHRHISQLFGLYPADLIDVYRTPELARAADATITRRLTHGGGHTGWSRAWIINMYARLHNGEKVQENITALLAHSTADSMLDMHPPFQIDGNFGGGAGIAEALLQSVSGIEFIPALPPAWKAGKVSHLRARGGFDVSFEWKDGAVTEAEIISLAGCPLAVRAKSVTIEGTTIAAGEDGLCHISIRKGESCKMTVQR